MNPHTPTPIVVLGEALMDCIANASHASTDGLLENSFTPHLGGSPYNVARAIAKQAGEVWFLNPLSTDDFGQQLAKMHAAEGVHSGLAHNALPTSLAMVSFIQGQPSYQFYREGVADRAFTAADALAFLDQFPSPGVLHTGSLALVPPESEKTLAIVQAAKKRGWIISVDVNVRVRLARDLAEYRATLLSFIGLADWLKASDEDLEHIIQNDTWLEKPSNAPLELKHAAQLAQQLHDAGVQRIALTFGEHGAFLRCGELSAQATAPQVTVVDTVGAGDTFWGTCLRLWTQESRLAAVAAAPPTQVLATAMHAAALNCTLAGCNPPSLTTLNQSP